ncbi:hypothetical protein [Sphingomonas sp. PB4P5]|uniref:hypothetical protein n=1 Tax=Parasphingomonas puruogangriensis TaxID=3096155 RepID=UPI002FC5E4E6
MAGTRHVPPEWPVLRNVVLAVLTALVGGDVVAQALLIGRSMTHRWMTTFTP